MKIALIGATGFIGSALRKEALARGHAVTALVSRPERLTEEPRLKVLQSDARKPELLAPQLEGHDLAISAFSGHGDSDVYGYYMQGVRSIIEAARRARLPRLLVVGGAGSLEVSPGVTLIDTPQFPKEYKATAEGARDALKLLRSQADLDWTMLSPAPVIRPGERTGKWRVGGDRLLGDEISVEDYAAAMLDEAEKPAHRRERFTVAY